MTQTQTLSGRARLTARRAAKFAAQDHGAEIEIAYLGETVLLKVLRINAQNTAHEKAMADFRKRYRHRQTGAYDATKVPEGELDKAIKASLASNVIVDLQISGDEPVSYTPDVALEFLADDDFYFEVMRKAQARDEFEAAALKADAGN